MCSPSGRVAKGLIVEHGVRKPVDSPTGSRPMLVVVHDCAPVFVRELSTIVTALLPVVGQHISVAVVPCWRGCSSGNGDAGYRELLGLARERLLHGWTHQSRDSWRPVSLLTGRADEFRGLDATTIRERIRFAQAEFTELTGEAAQGLLPPAWQLPIRSTELGTGSRLLSDFRACSLPSAGRVREGGRVANRLDDPPPSPALPAEGREESGKLFRTESLTPLRFVMRFRRLECCRDPQRVLPLVTWSWDWGRLGWLARGGELFGSLLSHRDPSAIPCVALHPADVRRGCVPHAVRIIRQLIDSGHEPTTATELMSDAER